MLVYNTTYHIEESLEKTFLIWIKEVYLVEAEKSALLRSPRILRILNFREPDACSYSVQFEVESSATLHRWHMEKGAAMQNELVKMFKDKVVAFSTLMEVVE